MFATFAIAPLLLAQAANAYMVEQQYETRDVAYEQLQNGDAAAALVALEAALAENPDDPATLINLGSAHSALGNLERAEYYYNAARNSSQDYRLELANGRWMDSREAASLALASVELRALATR